MQSSTEASTELHDVGAKDFTEASTELHDMGAKRPKTMNNVDYS